MSPIKVFAVLIGLVAAIVIVAEVARDDAPPVAPQRTASPADFSLTNSEAIARFKELRTIVVRAIRQRDPSLVSVSFSPASPAAERISREIERLRRDRVIDRTQITTLNISVISNTPERIRLREVTRLEPCFVTERGRDVTRAPSSVKQVGVWTLTRDGSLWQLENGVLKLDRVLDRRDANCP